MATELWAVGLVIIGTVIGAAGALFFKLGADKVTRKFRVLIKNYRLFLGVFLYGVSSLFFLAGLKGGDLSVLYPVCALSYVWICLLSIKYVREKMNWWKWGGILIIIIGVAFIGFGS